MRNLPIHWSEGLFLRPHHFQAAERSWTEAGQRSEQWDHQFNYGVRRIELSEEAIANYQVQVNHCHARMRDGTLIALDPGEEPDRVDLKPAMNAAKGPSASLKDAFASTDTVQVFLGVPKLKIGSTNVARTDEQGKPRYHALRQSTQDESRGGNDQELEFRRLNVRVLLSTDDLSGYEVLPIAQIQRAGEREATPRIDPNYFPPMLATDAWAPLALGVVRAIYDILGKKIEVLSEQVVNRSIGFESQEPGDLDRLFMLSRLNEASATLEVIAFAAGIHPLVAYSELCRIVGQLAIFVVDWQRRTPELPRYDHDDLARIFRAIKERIQQAINSVRDYEYEMRPFVGVGLGMQVSLEMKWFNSDWQWYVGVMRGELTEAECREMLSPGQLDLKLGSSRQVEILFTHRAEGVALVPMERPPRALPASREWLYYQVSRQNAAWKDVAETHTLAMRLKDSLIVNRDKLSGERKLIVSLRGRQVVLQFALFAVPTHA
ncbi:MAG TPA: type VI secretion system baseplate subunit TssK [Pirellulales bacterium]|jgi:type VI secretion system protein ImpJ|nr:type VI secretion system baseplate subunit TssK [Pirellulales bacterium]